MPSSSFRILFHKRLDDRENAAERQAKRKGTAYQAQIKKEMHWNVWKRMKAEVMLKSAITNRELDRLTSQF